MSRTTSAIAILLLGWAVSAGAQSLGDVAKKEEARRKRVAKPAKVYTNESLRGGDATSPAPASDASQADAGASSAPPAGDAPATDRAEDRRKNEQHWRDRVAKAREELERAKTFQEALQSRINALTADFTRRDDPAQRAVIGNNRQKALAELERVTKEIAGAEQKIRDIEEEARKAGVPPGWLR